MSDEFSSSLPYFIGCPVWTWPEWKGTVYAPGAPRADWLAQYARKFNTVEGNTTFYATPAIDTVQRWAEQTPEGFRFALKFPQAISHDRQLKNCEAETELFLNCLSVLKKAQRLGPSFLQLPPHFGPNQFADLVAYLHQLPKDFPYALEVRHHGYYEEPFESRLNEVLRAGEIDRVVFDSRPLFASSAADDWEVKARKRKPQTPIRKTAIGSFPILRLIGRNDPRKVDQWIEEWVPMVAEWISQGRQPFVFTHAPDDTFAPLIAHRFHESLRKRISDLACLPELGKPKKQKSLF